MTILALTCAVLAAVSAAGCGNASNDEGAGGGGPITLGVGVDSVFAPMFLADQQGHFEKEGLDVTIKQFAQGGESVDAVIAGTIQTASAADTTLLGKMGQGNIQGLGVFVEDVGNYVKLAARDGISNPRQIKTMGIVPGSVFEWGALAMLEHFGIDPDTVRLVPAGPPELPALLEKGDIDAFVAPEPWPTQAEKVGGRVLMPSKEWGLSYVLAVSAKPEWIKANPEQAEALMRALGAAAEEVERNPEAAAEATQKAAKVPPELTKQAVRDLDFGVRGFTPKDERNFQDISSFLVERKLVKEPPPVETFTGAEVVESK